MLVRCVNCDHCRVVPGGKRWRCERSVASSWNRNPIGGPLVGKCGVNSHLYRPRRCLLWLSAPEPAEWLTQAQVARRLGVSESTAKRIIAREGLWGQRIEGDAKPRYDGAEVEVLVEARERVARSRRPSEG
jgi:hypothetical protein